VKKKPLLIIFSIIIVLIILSFRFFEFLKPYTPHLNYLLGTNKPTTYLILLGNDTEARANAGFAGSYAKVVLSSPQPSLRDSYSNQSNPESLDRHTSFAMTIPKIDFSFHDIYVPNGQLEGYVKPPDAIQQAFGHGTWQLANADYEPNFPTAAASIRWFLEKGKETNPDILATLNLSTIKQILNIVGSFPVSDSNNATITPDNLYLYLQGKAELNFFPGSTQKADALHSVGVAAIKKAKSLSLSKKYQIAKIIFEELNNKNIVINSTSPEFQKLLESQNFAGAYDTSSSFDKYGLVELNLGSNKANSFVTRETSHRVTQVPAQEGISPIDKINHQINIKFHNTSPEANPNPPLYYGGNYIAYMRIYIPSNAANITIDHSEIATDSSELNLEVLKNQKVSVTSNTLTMLSFWHITKANNQSEINLSYTLPVYEPGHSCEGRNQSSKIPCYSLTIIKQNGFPSSPQTLNIFQNSASTELKRNYFYLDNQGK